MSVSVYECINIHHIPIFKFSELSFSNTHTQLPSKGRAHRARTRIFNFQVLPAKARAGSQGGPGLLVWLMAYLTLVSAAWLKFFGLWRD